MTVSSSQIDFKKSYPNFKVWLKDLERLAREDDILWVMDTSGTTHLDAYQKGRLPAEEIQELHLIAEWRGCGCGGGS